MITRIPSADRYRGNFGWLDARWHFSFGDYYDPKNLHWSSLRVFNDDVVQGGGGFDLHPHRDMEIVTYVIDGGLAHHDDHGGQGVIHPGEVQVMSAGTGIMHAEHNASQTAPVRLNQIWLLPKHKGNKPRYEQKQFTPEQRAGKLLPVVSNGSIPGTLAIDQDATVYVTELKPGQSVTHQNQGKHAYVFAITGNATVNGTKLEGGDQARIADENSLTITADSDAHVMLLDLP
jgi:redox-sensitive bicupin YhaK (pirin superfamily)